MEWAVGLVTMRSPMLSDLWGEVGGGVWGVKNLEDAQKLMSPSSDETFMRSRCLSRSVTIRGAVREIFTLSPIL